MTNGDFANLKSVRHSIRRTSEAKTQAHSIRKIYEQFLLLYTILRYTFIGNHKSTVGLVQSVTRLEYHKTHSTIWHSSTWHLVKPSVIK